MIVNKYTNSRWTTLKEIKFGQINNAKKILTFLEMVEMLAGLSLVIMIGNAIAVQGNYPYVLTVKCNKWHIQVGNWQAVKCRSYV